MPSSETKKSTMDPPYSKTMLSSKVLPLGTGLTSEEFEKRLHVHELSTKAMPCLPNSLNRLIASGRRVGGLHHILYQQAALMNKKALDEQKKNHDEFQEHPKQGAKRAFSHHHYPMPLQAPKTTHDSVDYGYGKEEETSYKAEEEPATKRRRMQRRNSKTPAMLMAMDAALVAAEYLKEERQGIGETDVAGWLRRAADL